MPGFVPATAAVTTAATAAATTAAATTAATAAATTAYLKRFGAYAPRLWNELPDNIKAADSVQNFKKQLKTLLFRKEFI